MRGTCIAVMRRSRAAKRLLDRITQERHIGYRHGDKKATRAMTVLENAVHDLANALENLESNLENRLDDLSAADEAIIAARRQALAARKHASDASSGLTASISDLKALLNANSKDEPHGGS